MELKIGDRIQSGQGTLKIIEIDNDNKSLVYSLNGTKYQEMIANIKDKIRTGKLKLVAKSEDKIIVTKSQLKRLVQKAALGERKKIKGELKIVDGDNADVVNLVFVANGTSYPLGRFGVGSSVVAGLMK